MQQKVYSKPSVKIIPYAKDVVTTSGEVPFNIDDWGDQIGGYGSNLEGGTGI